MNAKPCLNISTTPLGQWGFRQRLPFSWTTLKDENWSCKGHLILKAIYGLLTSPVRSSPGTGVKSQQWC